MNPKALAYKHAKFKLREARRLYRLARNQSSYYNHERISDKAKELEKEANQVLGSIDKWFETV